MSNAIKFVRLAETRFEVDGRQIVLSYFLSLISADPSYNLFHFRVFSISRDVVDLSQASVKSGNSHGTGRL